MVNNYECLTTLERREEPPCAGPSLVRISCTLRRSYSTRRLGDGALRRSYSTRRLGGGAAVLDHRDGPAAGDQRFYVYDFSVFLRYEDTRRVFHGMLEAMPLLRGVDLSPDNCVSHSAPKRFARRALDLARKDDDEGLGGGGYHFDVAMGGGGEARLEYSEPKAVVRAFADTAMQTVEPGSAGDQCTVSVCMEGFQVQSAGAGEAMAPLNLPCSHCFHVRCITTWLFRGHTCPVCRHDLRGLLSAPWKWRQHKLW